MKKNNRWKEGRAKINHRGDKMLQEIIFVFFVFCSRRDKTNKRTINWGIFLYVSIHTSPGKNPIFKKINEKEIAEKKYNKTNGMDLIRERKKTFRAKTK